MTERIEMIRKIQRLVIGLVIVLGPITAVGAGVDDESEAAETGAEEGVADSGETESANSEKGDGDTPGRQGDKWGGRLRDHAKQGFVNILAGTGYYLVAPYDKDNPDKMCAVDAEDPTKGEPLCSGRVGWHMDFLAGYGLKPGFELFMMFRLGLERPDSGGLINQPKTRQLGIGIKVYTPKDGFFKLGFGVAPLFDFSDRGGSVGITNDFVIHVPIQALFDIFPWFGAYAQIAPNLSFISEFKVEFTGGIGLQGRFP